MIYIFFVYFRTFDNTFLFVGSVATTIGYGHIVPKTKAGKATCVGFTIFAVPLFAILIQDLEKKLKKYVSSSSFFNIR